MLELFMKKHTENKGVIVLFLILIGILVFHWRGFKDETVVVTGESETKQANEVASFSAGVNVIKEKKEEAVDEVNKKVKELVTSVKDFGIAEGDIQTQSVNVYEQQETDKSKKNQWVVNSTVEITLRDMSKANDLMDLLNKSGANNIYGPSFRIENTTDAEKTLYDSAMADAKEKAGLIANSSGRKLGKVINVVEGNSGNYSPIYKTLSSGAGGAELSPGTSTISKTLTVTFEFN